MGYRQIYIKEGEKLSLSNNSLVVTKKEEKISFPLEDLDLIFIENPNVLITAHLICEAANKGVSIIFCGSNYLPSSLTIPLYNHYIQTKLLKLQFDLLPSKKNKLWDLIIKQKISNQMEVIANTNYDEVTYKKLKDYRSLVKFGDEKNMEGVAAREYFKSLFGEGFIRFEDTPINVALNYGYSIINSAIIRSVTCSGLNDSLGIWHHNDQNSNNLSSDIIELFRAYVDFYVYHHIDSLITPLPIEIRKDLINLLNSYIIIDNKKYKINYAIGLVVSQYINYLDSGNIEDIKLPSFIVEEENHVY